MKHKNTPQHNYWHRKVEGQIRDTIYSHPEWFQFTSEADKAAMINALAKRIVGEIIAGVSSMPV